MSRPSLRESKKPDGATCKDCPNSERVKVSWKLTVLNKKEV